MGIRFTFNTLLCAILFSVAVAIAAGTAAVFATRSAQPGANLRRADPEPESVADPMQSFNDLGQIRTSTAAQGESQAMVILRAWFAYEGGGTEFREELSGKRRKIRGLIADYFQGRTYGQLLDGGEGKVKGDLLRLINGELSMGEISAVYFEEYLFLEY